MAGWIFADLLAAFLVIALGSQIAQSPAPAAKASPAPSRTSPAPKPKSTAPLGLRRDYVKVELPDTSSVAAIRNAIRATPGLAGRRAGMVLTFGRGGPGTGEGIAEGVNQKLPQVDKKLFGTAVFRRFNTVRPVTNIEIYLY